MNLLKTDPVRAYMFQDHLSHIQVHMDAAKDPKMMQIIQSAGCATEAHFLECQAIWEYKKVHGETPPLNKSGWAGA